MVHFNEIDAEMSRLKCELVQKSEELKAVTKCRDDAQNELTCIDIRYESLRQKSSERERELTEMLDEMRQTTNQATARIEILEKNLKELELVRK